MAESVNKEPEKKKYGKYDDWEIESAVRTIIEAERIKLDTDKMKYVLPLLEEQKKALEKAASAADILYGDKKEQ